MSKPEPAPAPRLPFFSFWPVQTGRTLPRLIDWVRPPGLSFRPVPTEFPFSFASIEVDRPADHLAFAAEVLPAGEAEPVLGLRPVDFEPGESGSRGVRLPPLPEALGAVLPPRAPLIPLAPVSMVAARAGLASAPAPIEIDPISRQPAMPCLADALERAADPTLAAAAPLEYEHAVEERLVEPVVAGCARSTDTPWLPGAAPAIAAPAIAWPGLRAPSQPRAATRPARPQGGYEAVVYGRRAASLPAFRVENSSSGCRGIWVEPVSNSPLGGRDRLTIGPQVANLPHKEMGGMPPPGQTPLAPPIAEAVERWMAVRATVEAAALAARPVALPALELESASLLAMPGDRAGWLPPLEPEQAEMAVHALAEPARIVLPAPAASLMPAPIPPVAPARISDLQGWQAMDEAEAVEMLVRPAMAEALPAAPVAALPPFAWFYRGGAGVRVDAPLAEPSWEGVGAEPVESLPAAFQAKDLPVRPELCLPAFEVRAAAPRPLAGFGDDGPVARPQAPRAFQPLLEPTARSLAMVPRSGLAAPVPALAAALPIPLEFFSRAPSGTLRRRISPIPTSPQAMLPVWNLQPAAGHAPEAREPKRGPKLDPAEVFHLPEARPRRVRPIAADALKALAASLLVGSLLWYGVPEIRQARRLVLVNRGGNAPGGSSLAADNLTRDDGPDQPGRGSEPAASPGSASPGLMERIRGAMASRAATEIADNFHGAMNAWDAGSKSLAPGWSRSKAGFVRPGRLALLRPSLGFADYRLEFLGEIENKSLDWVVRAADSKNYYAMKFTVVAPGPRPAIAMVHYPVVGGKAGHRVEIPLSVMVHNHTPYRVSVDVSGDRIVTSIEGEEVDSWTDTALAKGGIGFFAEAGERAKLYWVKVAHNDDWIGRICAYFTNDGGPVAAGLEPGSNLPAERRGSTGAGQEPELAAAALAFRRRRRFPFFFLAGPQYSEPQDQDHRRFPLCHLS